MHGFFFLWPALLFFGVFKILLFVLLVVLVVRLLTHGHGHAAYAHGRGGYGYRHGSEYDAQNFDPRRVAAWRYASGQIDRAEFDRVIAGLDANTPAAPPSTPAPPA